MTSTTKKNNSKNRNINSAGVAARNNNFSKNTFNVRSLSELDNIRITINGSEMHGNKLRKYSIGVVYVAAAAFVCDNNSVPPEKWYPIAPSKIGVRPSGLGQILMQFQIQRRDVSEGALPPEPVVSPWTIPGHHLERYRVQLGCYKLLRYLTLVFDACNSGNIFIL